MLCDESCEIISDVMWCDEWCNAMWWVRWCELMLWIMWCDEWHDVISDVEWHQIGPYIALSHASHREMHQIGHFKPHIPFGYTSHWLPIVVGTHILFTLHHSSHHIIHHITHHTSHCTSSITTHVMWVWSNLIHGPMWCMVTFSQFCIHVLPPLPLLLTNVQKYPMCWVAQCEVWWPFCT